MALIRIKTPVSGADFAWRPGEVVDLPDAEAAKWADGVRAEYADPDQAQPESVEEEPVPPAGDDEPPAGDQPEPPAGNASLEVWRAYVVETLKVDPAEIEGLGRNELRDRYGAPMDTEA